MIFPLTGGPPMPHNVWYYEHKMYHTYCIVHTDTHTYLDYRTVRLELGFPAPGQFVVTWAEGDST